MLCLVSLAIFGKSSHALRIIGMIQAPHLDTMNLSITQTPRNFQRYESIADKYPQLRWLSIHGALERGILTHFPMMTKLSICDNDPLATSIRDIFDASQDVFSTLTPRLSSIIVQETFEETIRSFCADRKMLWLAVPEIKVIRRL
ncbi:hypothetical protein FIBSPDRAFT_960649 [Athelia psychrophila]|uniref:Uncharacterized protein n=1 Tax=Athelia psychrophila TaxID=1759441 RepID=A0A166C7D9_9AGAM|nr:hypothetical protein FIBSPDRAFT_960649 [Fibularhizoctonia sp. CBS 109695]